MTLPISKTYLRERLPTSQRTDQRAQSDPTSAKCPQIRRKWRNRPCTQAFCVRTLDSERPGDPRCKKGPDLRSSKGVVDVRGPLFHARG